MEKRRVKVIGYAQREFYNNGIEYRNFSDDLVGNQFTSNGGTALFTLGNFNVTTNLEPRLTKNYKTGVFSKYYTLNQLQLEDDKAILGVTDPKMMRLNIDKAELSNYAYFGSMREYARVSVEEIIMKWPASLFLDKIDQIEGGERNTYLNKVYNRLTNTTTFNVNIYYIKNDFDINIKQNGTILNTFNRNNKLRDMNVSFSDYVLMVEGVEYPVTNFIGYVDTNLITFEVKGNPFPNNENVNFHIKPNEIKYNQFFYSLDGFSTHLMNRNTLPKYSGEFNYTFESDSGVKILGKKKITWPVSDGYNIDFKSEYYAEYLTTLLDITGKNDELGSNIIYNKLITKSLIEFDTIDGKMDKTLKVYGRNMDEIKTYIDGIRFVNHISYDKKNNIPDRLVKNLARTMGWELTTSLFNVNLSEDFFTTNGELNLSPVESEIEFWRRIVINTPWIWKSKGTRKVVEFLLRFVGTPKGLIRFNEYIYRAGNTVDVAEVKEVYEKLGLEYDENKVVVDGDGYPKVLKDSNGMYFQKGGEWYRNTSGEDSSIELYKGNNPHMGPYDGGYEFINQFNSIVPYFESTFLEVEKVNVSEKQIFNNYNYGNFNNILTTGEETKEIINSFLQIYTSDNLPIDSNKIDITESIIKSPIVSNEVTAEGFALGSYRVGIKKKIVDVVNPCDYTSFTLDGNGLILFKHGDGVEDYFIGVDCCTSIGFEPELNSNSQYVCRWKPEVVDACGGYTKTDKINSSGYVLYINDSTGALSDVVPTLECCTKEGFGYVEDNGTFRCIDNNEEIPTCEDYTFTGNFDESGTTNYALFTYNGGTTSNVLSADCCTVNGLDSMLVNGGVKCVSKEENCSGYLVKSINEDGLVLFENSDNIYVNELSKAECCADYGYLAKSNSNGTFSCYEAETLIVEPKLTLISTVDDGLVMKITGEAYSTVKYRVTVNEPSDHGFLNVLYNNYTSQNVTPSNPTPVVGSYCEGTIQLNAVGEVEIIMTTTVRPPLRDFTNNCAILEFSVYNYDNITLDVDNKLINTSCYS